MVKIVKRKRILFLLFLAGKAVQRISSITTYFRNAAENRQRTLCFLVLLLLGCSTWVGKRPYVEVGIASYYALEAHGRLTASGERYDMYKLTAAHRTLPFGTIVRVTNLKNGKSVLVRINDRGPGIKGRIIDLSYEAARRLGILEAGLVRVRLEVVRWGQKR